MSRTFHSTALLSFLRELYTVVFGSGCASGTKGAEIRRHQVCIGLHHIPEGIISVYISVTAFLAHNSGFETDSVLKLHLTP